MSGRYAVEEIEDSAGLQSIEAHWRSLWERCPSATPFQLPEWLISWWQAFSPGKLKTLCVQCDRRLVGLAPLYVEHDTHRVLPVGLSVSDYLDVLVDTGHDAPVCAMLCEHLREISMEWRSIELSELAPQATARHLPTPVGLEERIEFCSVCPVIELPQPPSGMRDAVPAHRMQALRTAWNRAARIGAMTVEEATPNSFEHWLALLNDLHQRRWQSVGCDGVLADARVIRFLDSTLRGLIAQGHARIYGLKLNGRYIAIHLVLVARQRMLSYMSGFDVQYSRISPGAILLGHAIEQALAQGMREFDFLRGEEPYKYLWGAVGRPNLRRVFRKRQ